MKDMDRFERASAVKERRVDSELQRTNRESLLHLSTVGSGTEYCEPSTGTCAMTDLSMADLVEIEKDRQKLLHSKQDVMKKTEKLKRENSLRSIHGYVALTSFRVERATIRSLLTMYLPSSSIPRAP